MPASHYTANYLHSRSYSPVIVLPTPEADRVALKNGTNLIDLLKPFGTNTIMALDRIGPAFVARIPSLRSWNLRQFGVRFVGTNEITALTNSTDATQVERMTDQVLSKHLPSKDRAEDGIRSVEDVDYFHRKFPEPTSWCIPFVNELIHSLRYSDTELVDMPYAAIVAVSGNEKESNVNVWIENARNLRSFPAPFQRGVYDGTFLRTIAVIHDRQLEATDPDSRTRALNLHRSLSAKYPEQMCRFLEINCATNQSAPRDENGKVPNDVDNILAFTHDFISRLFLPFICNRYSLLNEKVSAVRKGLRNSIKNFFGRQQKSTRSTVVQGTNTYALDSIEGQCRLLADLSYILQDYDSAYQCYKMCVTDYQTDKMFGYLASANEMMAMTQAQLLLYPPSIAPVETHANVRDMASAFDTAINTYLSINDTRRSSRCSFIANDCYQALGMSGNNTNTTGGATTSTQINEALSSLLRTAEKDTSTRGALLFEQGAYLFLDQSPLPLIRKYAYYLILAGDLFNKNLHKPHAVRCYTSARSIYVCKGWTGIEDYVHFQLGKDHFTMSHLQEAVSFFVMLIGNIEMGKPQTNSSLLSLPDVYESRPSFSRPSPEQQQVFLGELKTVAVRWSNGVPKCIPDFHLPYFLDSTVDVVTHDPHTVASCYANAAWNATIRSHRLTMDMDLCNKPLFTPTLGLYREADRGCIVGERMSVAVDIVNPLQVDLAVSHIRLRAKHVYTDASSGESTESTESSVVDLSNPEQVHRQDCAFIVFERQLHLKPSQKVRIELFVQPLKEGMLHISGVEWQLFEILHGFHEFNLPMRKMPAPNARSKPMLQPDPSLSVPIMPPYPHLSLTMNNFPEQCFHGEYVFASLRISNSGAIPLHNIQVRISHPAFVLIGKPSNKAISTEQQEYPGQRPANLSSSISLPSLSTNHSRSLSISSEESLQCYPHSWADALIEFGLVLQPNETITLPVFIRGAVEGSHNVGMLFRYEPLHSLSHTLRFRLSYLSFPLTVSPLFAVKVFQKGSFGDVRDTLLGVDVIDKQSKLMNKTVSLDNKSTDASTSPMPVSLTSVSMISKSWVMTTIGKHPQVQNSSANSLHEHVSIQGDASLNEMVVLNPFDSASFFFRASNLPAFSVSTLQQLSSQPTHFSRVVFAPNSSAAFLESDCNRPPLSNLLAMEKAIHMDEERQAFVINPAAKIPDVGAPNKFDLAITWCDNIANPKRFGCYHVVGLNTLKLQATACPLKVHLSYPFMSDHDFSKNNSLHIPVTVYIRNALEDQAVTFTFETLAADEEFEGARRQFRIVPNTNLRHRYLWMGTTKARVVALERQSITVLQLIACVTAPGQYNLNRFRFITEVGGKRPRTFFFPLQHLCNVVDSAATNLADEREHSSASLPIDKEVQIRAEELSGPLQVDNSEIDI